MKAVIVSVVGLLLAISAQAQNTCSKVPTYDENIIPTCTAEFYNKGIKLPNYANVQSFYTCPKSTTKVGEIQYCDSSAPYFSLTYQSCNTCENYLPAVKCSGLNLGLDCIAMNSTASTTAAPPAPTPGDATISTTKPTSVTNAPATTTTAMPGPPEDTSTPSTPGDSSGTTIFIPQPPSPNEGPTPPGPDPTAPNLPAGPPEMR